ncbi:hypothetical protein [Microbacterium sp. NFH-22A-Y]|uniref:hypothetical protein n=1 Tax=Microbacterium sp. NFH-22A-Y TaxID=2744448 RepID=UPI001F3C973A|nr:hypothetical protein [Microbacterium sp. NFH-22A-Y]
MSTFDPHAYLGPFAADASDEQKSALTRAARMVDARYPGPDDDSEQAMSGAAQIILGDDSLEGLAATYVRARRAERDAMAQLVGAIIAESGKNASEVALADRSGLTRVTVRKALGK